MYFNVLTPRGIVSLATMSAGKNVSHKGLLGINKQMIALFLYFFLKPEVTILMCGN